MSLEEDRMDEELQLHLEMQTRANVEGGMAPGEARRAALLALGGVAQVKEACRDQRRLAWLDDLGRDLRLAGRLFRKSPGFTAVAVLTLALGSGANTAMFSVVDAVILRPLEYPQSGRLVRLLERQEDGSTSRVNYLNFLDWRAQQTVFERIGVWRTADVNLTEAGDPRRVMGVQLSADALASLGVAPALGRLFLPEEDRPGAAPVVVVSHGLWQSRLGADPRAVGRPLSLDGRPHTVVGVMPPGFHFGGEVSLWQPVGLVAGDWTSRIRRSGLIGIARLAPGVSLEQARTTMDAIAARLEGQYPGSNKGFRVQVEPLLEAEVRAARRSLWVLFGAAALVLLIACANVAGLLLARGLTRQREMTVRAALGARRGRILRQILAESVALAAAGGLAGLVVARLALDAVTALAQGRIPRIAEVRLDGRVLWVSALVVVVTGVVAGLAPALRGSHVDLREGLRHEVRGGRGRLREVLALTQIALTVVLLAGAGLLFRSFHRLQSVHPGFDPDRVLTFSISLPSGRYPSRDHQSAFYTALLARLRALPGVEAASVASQIPLDERSASAPFAIPGQPEPPLESCPEMELHLVERDYFRALRIPLLRGRDFVEGDGQVPGAGSPGERWGDLHTVIIDEAFARRHFPGTDPIGHQIRIPWAPGRPAQTIVGVVGTVKEERLAEGEGRVQAYFPLAQSPVTQSMTVVLRTALPVEAAVASARREVLALDREQPLYAVRTLTDLRDRSLASERLDLMLLGLFAGVALVLAVVGLHGLLAFVVAQRRREIGVRMALGARPGQVLRQVIGYGLRLGALGAAVGLGGALVLARVLASLLYEVTPADPLTFAAVTLLVLVVAAAASALSGRRAARLDPLVALRLE
jgi:putative ABC transport system permease protein